MGRHKKNRNGKEKKSRRDDEGLPSLHLKNETKKAVLAIILFALSLFFVLSCFNIAGLAGVVTYNLFYKLFGHGAFLLPVLLVLLGIYLLRSLEFKLSPSRVIGGLIFFLSSLSIIQVIAGDTSGGVVGGFLASPLLRYFDFYASLIFLSALVLISLIITFDSHQVLGFSLWQKLFKKKEEEEEQEEKFETIKLSDASKEALREEYPTAETDKADKEPNKEKELKVNDGGFLSGAPLFGKKAKTTGAFIPPPISLLEQDSGKPNAGDIKANANIIKRTLSNFGISVEMDEVSIGPTVTRYALKPAEGMKLSRIVALQNDLALSLAAHPLRIEAPIPGKSLVGIEIPNKAKATIRLASLLSSNDFAESHHPLYVALGRDISGQPRFANLAKAPHLLIAGATGSGKSVTIHAVISSLLYRNSPEKMRFVMIDPKRVELTLYNKIPHLLTPVITDSKKAIAALRWLAKEMDRRYDILEAEAVRDIQSYHKNVLEPTLAKAATKKTTAEEGEADEADEVEQMPYIVVIIDELADIMTAYPRELEAAIVRLAQMSRAVGIHLVLSTQRPSVEVITGLIKANIPSRIALQVASQIDSRTILDMAGAEKLLGAGDMLYLSGEMSKPVRLQSAFISEDEVKRISAHLAKQYADIPPSDLNLGAEGNSGGSPLFNATFGDSDADDDLYEDARESVIQAGKASASYLQRKLKVGYARAARLLDMLEERGVIGPGEGAKPREVYGAPSAPEILEGDDENMI
ncbi:MAG TPA: DNA translocase FtsK 4TM domain-containing protein [Candidatus Paceibacterota bacterium]|jgi:S-DNA-T family DNA segregation ATPase FtsK/SpoIIIE|nr:DNA translocase FtsK 4TM domain-containing protein [Candidatus Paceibacterota bacterium]